MHGLYPTDGSWLDTAGRLLIVAFFVIVWVRNLSSHHVEDHIKRLTHFKAPVPRMTFWAGMVLDAAGCLKVLLNWHPAVGALHFGISPEIIAAVRDHETSPAFTPAERASLDFAVAAFMTPNAVTDTM